MYTVHTRVQGYVYIRAKYVYATAQNLIRATSARVTLCAPVYVWLSVNIHGLGVHLMKESC